MRLIAKKPCSYGGKKFFIGDEIPAELVVNIEREEKLGVISAANDEAGVPEQSGALYSQEQVDKMIADAVANADKGFTQEQETAVTLPPSPLTATVKPALSESNGFLQCRGCSVSCRCTADECRGRCKGSSQCEVR